MNKSRLIWGVICLVLAGAIGVLSIVVPPNSVMFYAGEYDFRWVPAVVLAIVGIVLLATVGTGGQTTTEAKQPAVVPNPEKVALNKRLENIGWGLFLIMVGGAALVPDNLINDGWWSIGVGLIMFGLNLARYRYQIKMSGFTTFLGIISIISGVLQLMGLNDLGGAIFLIVLGSYLLIKPWFDKRQLFGKAEES
jgi:hypothetical protein